MTLLVKNALIVDGCGGEPYRGDILTSGSAISAISNFPKEHSHPVIDANGVYVAPGFFDIHSEADHHLTLLNHPEQEWYIREGVTSAVGGHHGISLAPILSHTVHSFHPLVKNKGANIDWHSMREFLYTFSRRKLGVSFGTLVGFGAVERILKGDDARQLTKKERAVAEQMLGAALSEGALGISFEHNMTSAQDRAMIFSLAADSHAVCAISLGDDSLRSVREILKIKCAARPTIILQNLIRPFSREPSHEDAFQLMPELYEAGIYVELSPSEIVDMPIGMFLPEWLRHDGRAIALEKLHDEWFRKKVTAALPDVVPSELLIVHAPHHTSITGITLRDFMKHSRMNDAREALMHLMRNVELSAVVRAAHNDYDSALRMFMQPNVLVGSQEIGAYPAKWRSMELHGGFTSFLDTVQRSGIMPIAAAIKKITHDAAGFFGITDRGIIREGMRADLVGFKGGKIHFTIIGGRIAMEDDAVRDARNGLPLIHTLPR